MPNAGRRTEDLIETICTKMFFSDFTVRNPKYTKPNGQEKEAADFLVPFKGTLLAFQVRSKEETTTPDQRTHVDHARIQRKLDHGIGQLKAIREAVDGRLIQELVTVRGLTLPFDASSVKKLIGVVVLDLIGEEKLPRDQRTGMLGGFGVVNGIPVHVFMRDDFQELSTEIDTLPDFLAYLDTREALWGRNVLSPMTDELDFLAIYKTRPDYIQDFLSGKADLVVITGGIWEDYRNRPDTVQDRDKRNRPSYLIDDVIAWLHSSVGYEMPEIELAGRGSSHSQGSVQNYLASATELASLTRIQRRGIGERFLEKLRLADQTGGFRYGLIADTITRIGYVVSASDLPRKERREKLYSASAVAYCRNNLKKVVGISTEPLSRTMRSYDVIVLDRVRFRNRLLLAFLARKMFGKQRRVHIEEYGATEVHPTKPVVDSFRDFTAKFRRTISARWTRLCRGNWWSSSS